MFHKRRVSSKYTIMLYNEKQMSRTRNSLIISYSFQQIFIHILWFIFSIYALLKIDFVVIGGLF